MLTIMNCYKNMFFSVNRLSLAILFLCGNLCILNSSLAAQSPDEVQNFTGQVRVNLDTSIGSANPLILGNNLQWVDNGDDIINPQTLQFESKRLQLIDKLKPTILRYPGGTLADTYHWHDGIGPLPDRKTNLDLSNREKKIILGTDEFLKLTERLHAEAVITLNVSTGTVDEAVSWLTYVNGPDKSPVGELKVKYWEVGNEPYLWDQTKVDGTASPKYFAEQVNKIIPALLQRDPRIKVGIPLRSDFIGGIPATPVQGFNDTVLANVKVPLNFVALHNAYLPYANQRPGSDEVMYWGAMAAAHVIEEDFATTRALLQKYGFNKDVKIAVTEYNSMFTLKKGKTDAYLASLSGALYVADAIRVFAQTPDLLFANFWSLAGNWYFGAFDQNGVPRPVYYVLSAYQKLLNGDLLKVDITSPSFNTVAVGGVPAQQDVPLLTALATKNQEGLHLIILNKSLRQAGNLDIQLAGNSKFTQASYSEITGDSPLAGGPAGRSYWVSDAKLEISDNRLTAKLRPYSMMIIDFI